MTAIVFCRRTADFIRRIWRCACDTSRCVCVQLIPLVLVVTMVVFFVMMIVPGDPVMVMLGAVDGAQVSREVYDAMRVRLGLDQPLIVQYLHWLTNLLQGDLGISITHRTAALEVILQRLVPTMYLMVGGLIMAVIIAVPAGVLAAIHNNTKWDHLATAFVVAGISVPTFWLALVAVLIFAVYLGWLPAIGYTRPQDDFVGFLKAYRLTDECRGLEYCRHGPTLSAPGLP